MATTANTQVQKFITDGNVSFKNLIVDSKTKDFSIDFAFIEGRQRKFDFQTVTGKLTPELYDWFTRSFIKSSKDGISSSETTTQFKEYLKRKGLEFKPGILKELTWECKNRSQDSDECPFRLTISPMYNTATLNVVFKYAKVVKDVRVDPNTGEEKKTYGYKKYANMKRQYFRRLEIFIAK